MERIDQFTYQENGKIIIFTPIPLKENQITQKYSFSIEDDEEMTQRLRGAVKHKEVKFDGIKFAAPALFEIIKEGVFQKHYTEEETENFVAKFYSLNLENPEFEIQDRTTSIKKPLFEAILINGIKSATGKGRTKDQARTSALENYFK